MRGGIKGSNITMLAREDGSAACSDQEITEEVIYFYKKLMGQSIVNLKGLDIVALRKGRQITAEQSRDLLMSVTDVDILEALKSMRDKKAPGVDGYNAKQNERAAFIDASQPAFIPGRTIQDNILMA